MREVWICSECHEELDYMDLKRIREPHGEYTLWTPCCNEAPIPEDEFDPTPYCSWCNARKPEQCDCGPIAENH